MKNKTIKNIRDSKCFDGKFSSRVECLDWLRVFGAYVKFRLNTFEVRMDAYYHNGNLYLSVDLYNFDSPASIPITILICNKCLELGDPECDEQEIVLPGLIDAFFLIKWILALSQSNDPARLQIDSQQGLWVSLKAVSGAW